MGYQEEEWDAGERDGLSSEGSWRSGGFAGGDGGGYGGGWGVGGGGRWEDADAYGEAAGGVDGALGTLLAAGQA